VSSYKSLKKIILLVLLFYFSAGLSTEIFMNGKEKDFPPFFSWFLFERVPNEKYSTKYVVNITQIGGEQFNPPVLYGDAKGIVNEPASPKARDLIRFIGLNLNRGSTNESEKLRKYLERVYLPRSTKYEILLITYNPLTYFKTGKIEKSRKLGEYMTN
jgi:hypothetical protein